MMPYVLFLAIAAIWSGSFMLMKLALAGFSATEVGAWRVLGGAAVLAILCWRRKAWHWPTRREWAPLLLVILAGAAVPYAVQPLVVQRQGSAFMALAVGFVPLATIVSSRLILGTTPSLRQAVGVGVALACLGLLLVDGLRRDIRVADVALAISVPLMYSVANAVIRGWLRSMSPVALTLYSLAASAALLFALAPFASPPPATPTRQAWWTAVTSLAVLGVLGTGFAMYWFNYLVQHHGPLFAGMVTNVVPLGAVLLGWADQETVSPLQLAALAGIVSMVALVQYGGARCGREIEVASDRSTD